MIRMRNIGLQWAFAVCAAVSCNLTVPLFSGHWDERGKPRSIRTTKAIAEGAIAEEEDRYGEAAAVPVARKKWNIECNAQDLEAMAQDFVLETRKIDIPGYPLAFNPSIIRWQGKLLMSFRVLPDPKNSFTSEMGIILLNEDFEPLNEPQILQLREETAPAPSRAEDLCFLTLGDRLFIIYDDNEEVKISKGGFRMYVAELLYDGDHFIVKETEALRHYYGESREIREKSWAPFVYEDRLLLAYSLVPHRILMPRLDGSGICDTACCSTGRIHWDFGILRGGTSASIENDQYFSFFHSSMNMATVHSKGTNILHYFMGAYTFSRTPPFAITAISPSPIIGKNFYNGIIYKPYWKPIRCVFPRGHISDGKFFWVSYGRDDHECWIMKIDKKKLLQSLVPVQEDPFNQCL